MADLKTRYLGMELKNPVIAGASVLTSNMKTIKKIEESGAAALVISSLFEEQIQISSARLEADLEQYDDLTAEMITVFPKIEHAGASEHLMWVRRAKESLEIPVIASLNAVNRETWVEYAGQLADCGVDALELNFYSLPKDFDRSAADIEKEQIDTLAEVKSKIRIPIAVKLSSFYTSPLHFIKELDKVGVDGFVLFNRLFQPKINIEKETNDLAFNLSNPSDHRMALRFAGLLYGKIGGSICANNGIHTAEHAVEVMLAGADAVQVVSTLFKNKIGYLGTMAAQIGEWMDSRGYAKVDDFRGNMSSERNPDPWAYNRGQYIKVLQRPGLYMQK